MPECLCLCLYLSGKGSAWKETFLHTSFAGQANVSYLPCCMMHTYVNVKNAAGSGETSTIPPQTWT